MKLKTLKDLERGSINGRYVYSKNLRQEAIKRVRSCKEFVQLTRNDKCGTNGEYCLACERDIWFNNLTEKDLEVKLNG